MTTEPLTDYGRLIDAVIAREIPDPAHPYVNDPTDPGGETCWGIDTHTAHAYGYTALMANMPRAVAVAIYTRRYWILPRLDQMDPLCPPIAAKLFDMGVNIGQGTAIGMLQRALNSLRGSLYPPLRQDGGIGPMTLLAFDLFLDARGDVGRDLLLFLLRAQQAVHYIELGETNPALLADEFGWETRAATV